MLQHPDVHLPWSQWSEEQTVHLIIPYSNPFRSRTRRILANNFIRQIRNTANVVGYVVELAYGDREFELTGESPTDVQFRTYDELWHKENLINLGVAAVNTLCRDSAKAAGRPYRLSDLPKYMGYSDADFSFTRHDWALEGIHLLQHHHFVQILSSYTDIASDIGPNLPADSGPISMNPTYARNYVLGKRNNSPYYGKAAAGLSFGSPGGGWLWTREAFDIVGGMLETCPLGSADWHMAVGLTQEPDQHIELRNCHPNYVKSIRDWQERAKGIERNIGCINHHGVHHFHGSKSLRGYSTRPAILSQSGHKFDPTTDLKKDWQGVWQLSGNKPLMRDDFRRYFLSRGDDNPSLLGRDRILI